MAVIITNIDPNTLEIQNYSNQDTNLIPLEEVFSQFDPFSNYIEYTIKSTDGSYQITEQNFIDYKIINDYSPTNASIVYSVDINPENDLVTRGFSNGEYNVIYNFLNNELNSNSNDRGFFIKEISNDRTEIKLTSNILANSDIEAAYDLFKAKLNRTSYFQDFYLNFGNNSLIIANNILLDNTKPQYELLINLYEALPNQFRLKDTLWVVTQVADPLAFNIQFQPEVIIPQISNPTIKGPNFDLPLKDRINNSSNYINYEQLLNTGLASSYQQIISYLNDKSIAIGVDYSNFSEFIHFSSAKSRIENFYYKIQLIEQYNSDITILGSSESSSLSSSISILQEKIDNVIKNFDGYEYWLYFETGSTTYPKGTTTPPYILLASNDPTVTTWYGNIVESASIYDQNNQDYLVNTIPDYLRDDPQNNPYQVFVNMIGQHYDNLWLYYKDVTNRYNGDNRLEFGISKDLVADALRSFGLKIYQNNFSTNDLYNAFTGFNIIPSASFSSSVDGNVYVVSPYIVEGDYGYYEDDITYYPGDPTELITNFVTASQEALFEPIDDVNKEIYKRLYHNLPLLLKQKGTVAGLRNLINVYGIPDTILRISEFGGRDKDTSTYDYFDQQFNYAFNSFYDSNVGVNWLENQFILHPSWSANNNRPESIQLRFKTAGLTNTYQSQSIFTISSGSGNIIQAGLALLYTGSGYASASYSGSVPSASYQFAKLDFYPNTSFPNATASVYLPFFDEGWWSIMVNRSGNTYTLYAGNNLYYDGYDGNQIGYLASSSITTSSLAWPSGSYFTLNADDVVTIGSYTYTPFTGSYQELRFWARTGSVESFKDFIMNPQSTDYWGEEEEYANYLAHRLPLGSDLITTTSSYLGTPGLTSVHPKVTGSWPTTQSFSSSIWGPNNTVINISNNPWYVTNIETRFLNSPVVGLKGRVTDKIQIVSQSLPQINLQYTQSGNTLSQYRSIQQQYVSAESETPDVNALEVAFSPQNEIDDDIIASLGYFNIGEYIGDPRQISSSATSYPDLNTLAAGYFQKYYDNYDLFDYIRLIKFFDNSLFKMIKDFVPARTNLRSGVVVKQHILERNKYPQPQMSWEDVTYTGSIDTAFFSGSTGGTFNEFNVLTDTQNIPFVISSSQSFIIDEEIYLNYFNISSSYISIYNNDQINWINGEIITYFDGAVQLFASGTNSPAGNTLNFIFSSSMQGNIESFSESNITWNELSPLINCSYGEKFSLWIADDGSGPNTSSISFGIQTLYPYSQQTWSEFEVGPTGSTFLIRKDQREFYNGELPGTIIEASNGELNEANIFKYPSTLEINYDTVFYKSDITPLENFLNLNTSPNQGEIYLWYDTGSTTQVVNPGGVIR